MKTRVIDLLNKIANAEEVPKKIKYKRETLTFDKEINNYRYDDGKDEYWTDCFIIGFDLNDEVEIIEEPKKFEFKFSSNGISIFTKSEEVEIIEEDKEIEKLERVNGSYLVDLQSNSPIAHQNEAITSLIMYLNKNVDKINELIRAVNELKKGK